MSNKNNEAVKLKFEWVRGTMRNAAMQIKLPKQDPEWIPTSCIQAFDPNTLQVTIETWILKKKGINYTV